MFYSLLNEQQRRLYAGLESAASGSWRGPADGPSFRFEEGTVARGRQELLAGEVQRGRVRRVGGGRSAGRKKTPEILSALRQLLRPDTAGDPMGRRGLWTGQHLEQISEQLGLLGIAACPNTVRRLLDRLGYALRANRKSLSGPQSPQRDRQFRYLNRQRQRFARKALPIISVDTKKKELVGCFKNAGRVWSREAFRVNDHDFRSQAKGVAIPHGLYDPQANRGSVVVGTSHDTPEFAVEAIVSLVAQGRAPALSPRRRTCSSSPIAAAAMGPGVACGNTRSRKNWSIPIN